MLLFDQAGPANTADVIQQVCTAAGRQPVGTIVVASNTGATARQLLDALDRHSLSVRVVVVTHVCEFKPGIINELPDSERQSLESRGCRIVTAAHALSAGERALNRKFGGIGPLELVAHTLRMFGQGTKVALEIALMARDAGAAAPDQPLIAIGGSGRGADTALLLTPGTSASLLDSRIHDVICKPSLL